MINFICDYLSRIEASDVIAFMAFLVGIGSLYLSNKHHQQTFKHSREISILLLKPMLSNSYFKDYETGEVEIKLLNNGLGPAIIDEIKCYYRDKEYSEMYYAVQQTIPENINHIKDITHVVFGGYSLKENNNIVLYKAKIEFEKENKSSIYENIKLMGSIVVEVKYTDVFGTKFIMKEKLPEEHNS